MKELVDGTIRVQIDIDPRFKTQFHESFPNIDMPVAIAPLVENFETRQEEEKPKGGAMCKLAGIWCKDAEFQQWVEAENEEQAAQFVRWKCGVKSRSEIDSNPEAANKFQQLVRIPYMNWLNGKGSH